MDELLEGARIEVGELKKDPRDFVLWKPSKDDDIGWDSPWGYGRPGWHIECSAMSISALGNNFDIHGGGTDLMFPHHENEIAQSEAATGTRFANIWMHNGPLRVDNEKMSKSLGNFFTVREVLKHYDPEVIRHLLVASHYRSPINHSEQNLKQSAGALERLYICLQGLDIAKAKSLTNSRFEKAFFQAMDDDFNTPEALAVLFDLARDLNRAKSDQPEAAPRLAAELQRLAGVLGLLQQTPQAFLKGAQHSMALSEDEIEARIAERQAAKANKDFARADAIRDELAALGIVLKDSREGTTWVIEAP